MKNYKILTAFACVLIVFCLAACKENAKTDTSSGIDVSTHNSQSAENYSDIGENDVATETPDEIFNDSIQIDNTQTDSTVFADGTTQETETNDTPDNADTTYESNFSEKEETHNSSEQSSSNEEIELPVDWFD